MSYRYTAIATTLIVLVLISACATPTPATTNELSTATDSAAPAVSTVQPAVPAPQPQVPAIAAGLQGLDVDTFFEASYQKLLLRDPEMITQIGLNDEWGVPNDSLTDISDEHVRETQQLETAILDLLRSYDRAALTPEQQVTYDVYEWHLADRAAGSPFMYHDYPASFLITTGINEQLLQFFTDIHPVTNKQDAQDYVTRLSQVDTKLDQLVAGLKLREQAGVVMPRFLVPWVLYSVGNIARSNAQATPFYTAFEEKVETLAGLSADEKEALLQAAEQEIDDSVLPGFQALAAELEHQQSVATGDEGVWKLPDGKDYYAYALRHHTTTDLTAAEIHQIGLDELDRIQAKMRALFDELGYPQEAGLPALIGRVAQDSGSVSGSAVAAAYEALIAEAWENLDTAFDLRPTANVIVQAGPAGDYYNPPAVDGSRPGIFYARVTGSTEKFAMPTLAYHEAVPGHHFQIAIAQQLPLPTLRKDLSFMAYTEGWALYAERLAYELGFYDDDPYGNIGRLQAEAFRAARLVVDTGIHDQRWSYDQAVDFMVENTGLPRDMVEGEVARYIVWPGQATAYKIGMIKMLELRQRAMDTLGDRFELKAFHNVVLGNGAMPLEVLERVVDGWIAAEQSQAVGGAAPSTAAATPVPASTPTSAAAQPEPGQTAEPEAKVEIWLKTYGGSGNTMAGDILPAGDGGFYVVGTTSPRSDPEQGDVYLLRVDAAGEIVWDKTYGGEGYDGGQSIAEAGGGNLLIAGVTTSFGAAGMDAYLLAVDWEGNELWSRTYGGPLDEMVGAVAQTADGGYLLGGNIVDPDDVVADPGVAGYGGYEGRSSVYLLRLDGDGNELWSRAYDTGDNVLAGGAAQTPDGGLLVLATITRFPDPDDDILLVKLDEQGDEIWSHSWTEGQSTAHELIETAEGNYLILGSYAPLDGTAEAKEDYLFIQVDPEGQEMWRRIHGHPDLVDHGAAMVRTVDGGYLAVGQSTSDLYAWQGDITLTKTDARGQIVWEQARRAGHSMFARILPQPDGGYIIAGTMFVDPMFHVFLIKTDSQGNMPAISASPAAATAAAEVSGAIEALASQDGFSGSVLMAHNGEPLFTAAYGLAERELDIPNQIDTLFNLGSMDKMFTGVAILQLVEQGRLALDDTIADVLPDYPNQEVAREVTIHHLLTHTSGMGDWFDSERYEELHDQLRSVEDYLPLLVDTPLEFEPGEQFFYSNSGYIVLGLIVQEITGQSYYDYVRESIFEPAGMTRTAAYELDANVPNRAIGYTQVGPDGSETGEITDYFFAMPMRGSSAGGGFSTAGDLLRFANALLDHDLLNAESTELLLQGKAPINDRAQYAYGFFDRMLEGQRVVGHGGGAPGICDYLDIYLDQGYTLVVLTNSDDDCLAAIEATREILMP